MSLQAELASLRVRAENLAGSWNGDNSTFIHEGEIMSEEDATNATDVVEKVDELLELLEEFKG